MARTDELPPSDLAEHAPDALLVVDAQGVIRYANREAHRLFGYDPRGLVNLAIESLIPARHPEAHARNRDANAESPEIREIGDRSAPLHGLRRDGTQFRAEIRLSPLVTANGTSTIAAVRDATDHDRQTSILSAARDAALQANDAKSRYIAAASHDLRQPLQTLCMINAAFRRQLTQAPFQAQLLREKQCLDAMSELLNALLNLGKLDSGTVVPQVEDFAIAPLLRSLSDQFSDAAAAKNLALIVDDAGAGTVRTDRALLRDVLQNLVGNAIRYTDFGSVRLHCRPAERGVVTIDVVDTGLGIEPAKLPRIWDEFYQVADRDGATHRGGAGLGLAIVKRIATVLGTAIRVDSAVGAGTTFSLDVPAAVRGEPRALRSDSELAAPADATPARVVSFGHRIILVDDDDAVRLATTMFLSLEGHTVYPAASLSEVDSLLESIDDSPSIVISDFRLRRNESGRDAIDRVRRRYGREIPAIVLTGDTSATPARIFADGNTRILNKPVDANVLVETVGELLGG